MKIALIGLGITGKIVAEYLLEKDLLGLVFCRDKNAYAGRDLGHVLGREATGVTVEPLSRLAVCLAEEKPDVLVDFSGPEFLREHLLLLEQHGVHVVTAVTAYNDWDFERLKKTGARGRIGIISVPNITYGVNVMMLLAQMAAKIMPDYDFEIIEEHHNQKKDIPSGTAKKFSHKIDRVLRKHCIGRKQRVPVHSIRSGGIIGKHKLIIAGKYDKIEISHECISRTAFAEGAHKAAVFIKHRTGYYEMEDVFQAPVLPSDDFSPDSTESRSVI